MNRRIGIIGVTGFIGRSLAKALQSRGDQVVGFSRLGAGQVPEVQEWRCSGDWDFSSLDAIVNLAGERVDQRWTQKNQQKFFQSRVGVTEQIVASLAQMPQQQRPTAWINASAVGFYGNRGDEICDETALSGEGYLAQLCIDWEAATKGSEELGVRCVMVRIGMVLGRGGMAWDRLRLTFSLGLGARLGSGQQWMPWIHLDDLVSGILLSLDDRSMHGVVNGVAPRPIRNRDFTQMLARALKRPAPWVAPAWFLRTVLGEFGDFILSSQRVAPQAWSDAGLVFQYPTIDLAFGELLAKK